MNMLRGLDNAWRWDARSMWLAAAAMGLALWSSPTRAAAPYCELYAPGHFGNWYEVASPREMARMLEEARHWGFNTYGDWFDAIDCTDPFAKDSQYDLANALWDAKKTHFRTAQTLGLRTDLVITPNHVYRDQLKPEWLARSGGRVFGQLICPSIPEARATILNNQRRLFADLAAAGVRLNSINLVPYDYGGCNCESCSPWIITFAKLSVEIYNIALEYHRGAELHFVGWWWSPEEHRRFAEWMDQHAPGAATALSLHIPYDKTGVADVPLPRGCRRYAFVHIGYAEEAQPRDTYGRTGPMIAAGRLEQTVRQLREQGVIGVVAYSEGIFDDVNKALLGRLWTTPRAKADGVLAAYARRYFQADEAQARAWADWLKAWGKPFVRDALAARQELKGLSGEPADWRRRQWALKCDLFIAHQAIMAEKEWSTQRLQRVEDFWAAYETLHREVYGLGPLRHILGPTFIGLPWYKSWCELTAAPSATAPISAEQ